MAAHSDEALDARLGALLAQSEAAPDARFTARVIALVEAEERLAAARRHAWRRFAGEALGAGAVALALLVLARMAGEGATIAAGPGLAGVLAVLAWLAASQGARATA